AVLHQRADDAFGGLGLVAQKFRWPKFFAQAKPDVLACGIARARPGRASLFALAVHGVGEGRLIDADPARFERSLGQIEREAVSVIERKGGVAIEHVALLQARALLIEDGKPAFQRLAGGRLLPPAARP